MVTYTCDKCGYNTSDKGKLVRHLNRKNPCKPSDTNKVTESILTPLNSGKTPDNSKNPPLNSGEINSQIDLNNELYCMYCGKKFKRRDNLTRHLKHRCSVLKSHMIQLDIDNKKNQEVMQNKIDSLEKSLSTSNIGTVNNTINNTINKPKTINTVNNIIINNYGNENLDYLTSEKINQLIEAPYTSIPKLIEQVHYHPKHPENHNMKITNKKDTYIKLLDGDTWKVDNRKRVIESLIDKGKLILDKFRDEELHTDFKNNCYDNFSHKLESSDKELIKQMICDLELLIINNS